jgi:hypothetical protein
VNHLKTYESYQTLNQYVQGVLDGYGRIYSINKKYLSNSITHKYAAWAINEAAKFIQSFTQLEEEQHKHPNGLRCKHFWLLDSEMRKTGRYISFRPNPFSKDVNDSIDSRLSANGTEYFLYDERYTKLIHAVHRLVTELDLKPIIGEKLNSMTDKTGILD